MARNNARILQQIAEDLDGFIEDAEATMRPIADATDLIADRFDVSPVEVQMHMAIHTWMRHRGEAERLFHAFGKEQLSADDTMKVKGYLALVIAAMTYLDLILNAKLPVIDQEKRKALNAVTKLMDRKLFEQHAES